jgi:hypothetical protein
MCKHVILYIIRASHKQQRLVPSGCGSKCYYIPKVACHCNIPGLCVIYGRAETLIIDQVVIIKYIFWPLANYE